MKQEYEDDTYDDKLEAEEGVDEEDDELSAREESFLKGYEEDSEEKEETAIEEEIEY